MTIYPSRSSWSHHCRVARRGASCAIANRIVVRRAHASRQDPCESVVRASEASCAVATTTVFA